MGEADIVDMATRVGSQPYLLIGALAALLVLVLLLLGAILGWAARHARGVWAGASHLWGVVARNPTVRTLESRFPVVWRTLRRLTAAQYLLLHVALGLALAFAALGFLRIAEAVTGEALVVEVDLALANALHAAASPLGIEVFRNFTFLGGGIALTVLGVLVAFLLFRHRHPILAGGWIAAVLGSGLLNLALKAGFERPRPSFADPIAVSHGWSFPSGHSMGTFVTVGMLAYLGFLVVRSYWGRIALVAGALVWIVMMGFSRMYLGVHYLSDVIAGFAAGTVWLAACISGVEIARRRATARLAPPPPPPPPRPPPRA